MQFYLTILISKTVLSFIQPLPCIALHLVAFTLLPFCVALLQHCILSAEMNPVVDAGSKLLSFTYLVPACKSLTKFKTRIAAPWK